MQRQVRYLSEVPALQIQSSLQSMLKLRVQRRTSSARQRCGGWMNAVAEATTTKGLVQRIRRDCCMLHASNTFVLWILIVDNVREKTVTRDTCAHRTNQSEWSTGHHRAKQHTPLGQAHADRSCPTDHLGQTCTDHSWPTDHNRSTLRRCS